MDCSILALVSDVVVDGQPLVGYGFSSNGRYSAGDILRLSPELRRRLNEAEPAWDLAPGQFSYLIAKGSAVKMQGLAAFRFAGSIRTLGQLLRRACNFVLDATYTLGRLHPLRI